ncbi:MAG: tRNA-guanine transglycosylase [Saprospiraceae bacterium]
MVISYRWVEASFHTESVMDIQRIIGADIVMAFDECTPYPCEYRYAQNSMNITHRWLKRCINRMKIPESVYGHYQTFSPMVG